MNVVTITLNPALDRTIYCDTFTCGATNRVVNVVEDSAGKGINVAKNLRALGLSSTIVAVYAGSVGAQCRTALEAEGHHVVVIEAQGETRTNQKIVDSLGQTTELNERGPTLTAEAFATLIAWIDAHAKPQDIYVLSGSLPEGVSNKVYETLITHLNEKGIITILDASGVSLKHGINAHPYCIKPNHDEMMHLLGANAPLSDAELIAGAQTLITQGIHTVVLSLGERGAYFITETSCIRAMGLSINSQSSVGAGDAMVAALVYSVYFRESQTLMAERAIATSAAAVETVGTKPGTKERIETLMQHVKLKEGVIQ